MWQYEKKLQYPVKIKTPNAKLAKVIISQLGGPYGKWILLMYTKFLIFGSIRQFPTFFDKSCYCMTLKKML